MDTYEATRIVFSRIQNLDPENASKIMGYLLIHDNGDKEMIRLAFGPETLLHSLILKAHKDLGLGLSTNTSNNNPTTTIPPFFPCTTTPTNPISISRQNSSSSSSPTPWGGLSDFHNNPSDDFQLQEHLSFFNDTGMGINKPCDLFYPEGGISSNGGQHRRSMSVTDICLGGSDSFGWKPCLYYARGYCKNGSTCRFVHDATDSTPFPLVGSPTALDIMQQHQHQHQHQRLAASPQLLASPSFPYSPSQRAAAAAMMLSEDVLPFGLGRSRLDRNDMNPGARQIYLTFPADSTFREEDVSNYFSIYGPVQDVRIPYQQKRMFGFVTFVHPETVKLILAKGNPHFVCDARVLVKPYKEKGKVPDKKQLQAERGEFSAPTTPNGHDSYEMLLGMQMQGNPRMMYNNRDLILRRKLEEQAELQQQAMELQSRRLMDLHLLDVNKHQFHRRNLSTGTAPIPFEAHSHNLANQGFAIPMSLPDQTGQAVLEENFPAPAISLSSAANHNSRTIHAELNGGESGKEDSSNVTNSKFHDSVEHNLPDSPFASPTKTGGDLSALVFSPAGEAQQTVNVTPVTSSSLPSSTNNNSLDASSLPATSALDTPFVKSCFLQMPRFSSGHGAVQM